MSEAIGVASGQPGEKIADMRRTAEAGAALGKRAGFPKLVEVFGKPVAEQVAEWLGYKGGRDVDAAQPFEPFEGDRGNRFSRNGGPWPEPKPLPDALDRMQCPPDFVAIPATVALGSVIGRKVGLRPQRKTDWYEVPNLWGCIVGRPGAMKSPAMDEALKPLHRLEAEARKANEAAAKDYKTEIETFKLRKEDGQKKGRAALKGGAGDIIIASRHR